MTSQGNQCSNVHPGHFIMLNSAGDKFQEMLPNFGALNCPQEVPLPLPSPWRAYRVSVVNLTG